VIIMSDNNTDVVELATALTMAWLGNGHTRATTDDVPAFLTAMHEAVGKLARGGQEQQEAEPAQAFTPAVSVRKSLANPDHIISMIDGKPYKALRRHLAANGLTPDQYRERYGLKPDYPMTAPSYSEARRSMAKKIGLGRKPGQTVKAAGDGAPTKTAVNRGRKSVSEAKKAAQEHLGDKA
jgi:predicted transcriptional regulator